MSDKDTKKTVETKKESYYPEKYKDFTLTSRPHVTKEVIGSGEYLEQKDDEASQEFICLISLQIGRVYYSIKTNTYHGNVNSPPLRPDIFERDFLPYLRWDFDEFNEVTVREGQENVTRTTKSLFPPTPENIAKKRKELIAAFIDEEKVPEMDAIRLATCPRALLNTAELEDTLRKPKYDVRMIQKLKNNIQNRRFQEGYIMSNRANTVSTGVVTFDTTKHTVEVPLHATAPESLEIHRMSVVNSDTSDASVALGFKCVNPRVYDYDGTDVTDLTQSLIDGEQITLGTGGKLIIAVPHPINSVEFDVDTAGGALSAKRYYNGTIATLNPTLLETLDPTSTGKSSDTFLSPSDAAKLPADHALVTAGIPAGMYIYQADIASAAILDAVNVYSFTFFAETVTAGTTLTDDSIKRLPVACQPMVFISQADAGNSITLEYTKR